MKLDTQFGQDFSLLIDAGFVAVKQGNRDASTKLFKAAQVLRPEHSAPILGFGYIAMHRMDLLAARKYFEEVLQKEPNHSAAKVYLGFCFVLAKVAYLRNKNKSVSLEDIDALANLGSKMVKEAINETEAPEIKSFGESVIELLKKIDTYRDTPLRPTKATT